MSVEREIQKSELGKDNHQGLFTSIFHYLTYVPEIHTGAPREGLLPSNPGSRTAVLDTCGKNHSEFADK